MRELGERLGHPVYRFDFRGHGESIGSLEDATLSQFCDDAVAVLEKSGPAVVIGSSLGGLIAAWTGARRPDLVRGLVLIAPALGIVPRLTSPGPIATAAPGPACSIDIGPQAIADALQFDERQLPESLTMPVMIAHGALDPTIPVAGSESLHAAILHAEKELWVAPDGDHSLHAHLDELLDRITRFVSSHCGG